MIRIAIADDHNLLTDSLKIVLESYPDFEIAGTAHDGLEAVELCQKACPDVILMDIKMPLMSGIEASKKIKECNPAIRVIILTSLEDSRYAVEALLGGVDAYILKDIPPHKLRTLIECVSWGFCVSQGNIRDMIKYAFTNSNYGQKTDESAGMLKPEDIEIIRAISEGKNNGEIAEKFGYADGTVKNRVTRLLEITGTGNRAQLVMFALQNKLL